MRKTAALALAAAILLAACTTSTTGNDAAGEASVSTPDALALVEDTTTTTAAAGPALDFIEAQALIGAIDQIGTAPSEIVHQVEGEFEGQAYSTTETVTTDPSTGISYVSTNFEEFSVLLDDLIERSIAADEASGTQEQSFGTTMLLVSAFSQDRAEYFADGETMWQLATETMEFTSTVEFANGLLAEHGEPEADTTNLTAALEDSWLVRSTGGNQTPTVLGWGALLPEFLQSRLGVPEAQVQIIDQDSTADRLTVQANVSGLGSTTFELDGAGTIRSVQYEAPSPVIGTAEQHSYTISDVLDTSILELPTGSIIDEGGFYQVMQEEMLAVMPEEVINANSEIDEDQAAAIEAELNG